MFLNGMRILVVGYGSIGKRHLRNLKALGADELLAYDPRPDRVQETGERGVASLKAKDKAWTVLPLPEQDVNEMHRSDARHLLDCLAGKAKPLQGLPQTRRALEVALAAKESAAPGRSVKLVAAGSPA